MSNDVINITYRGEEEFKMHGDMKLLPFCYFNVEFHFELSHFELDVDGKHCLVHYNFHKHELMGEMIC
jgi:hypothetical protein